MYNFILPKKEEEEAAVENEKNSKKKDDDVKQKNIDAYSPWSHLPLDLLGTIADRLYFLDEVRFRAVCKNWHCQATQHKTTLVKSLPWIAKLIRPWICRFEFQLYEPLTDFKPTAFHKIDFSQFLSTHVVEHTKITCKHGWLLFQIPRNDWCSTTFIFFSLLAKKVVTLPPLGHHRTSCLSLDITAFSVDPNSKDFVFLVLNPCGIQKHSISKFSRRENTWSSTMFTGVPFLCHGCAVFIRDIFYFVNRYGHVASYNIAAGVWKQESVSINHGIIRNNVRYAVRYAFELKGQLMIVCLGSYGESLRFCVRRFDWSKKVWVPVSSLGDRAICVGLNSFSVIAFKENATNCGVLPNMINVLLDRGCNVYSVENGGSVRRIDDLGSEYWNIARKLSVHKELNFWLEPPDYFVNKQPDTERRIVDNQEVNVAITGKSRLVEEVDKKIIVLAPIKKAKR